MATLLPPLVHNSDGKVRTIGIEIEYAGIGPELVLPLITELFGGKVEQLHIFDYSVKETRLGDFRLELDSSQMQTLGASLHEATEDEISESVGTFALPLLTKAASALVPWEIVTAPITLEQIDELKPLIRKMRENGALGTRHAIHFAFGLHLNPELPDLKAATILNYLRAFLCLYDWINDQEEIDWARKLSPYIRHFKSDYAKKILDPSYQPSMSELIDDYLSYNPTRNRSLDLLPLFAFIDEARVRSAVDDPRIKSRPTFHYRLPNCDIDNPSWNIDFPWRLWVKVEELAYNSSRLTSLCEAYLINLDRLTSGVDSQWLSHLNEVLEK